MTFPLGPPVDFGDLRAEFGGTVANPLGDYVRGGAFVPDVPQNIGVPTAAPISLGDFYGSVAEFVTLQSRTINDSGSGNASASATFADDGRLLIAGTDVPPVGAFEWLNTKPSGGGSAYDIMATQVGGPDSPTGPALGQWWNLSVNRTWTLARSLNGVYQCDLEFEIRPAGGGANLADELFEYTIVVSGEPP